MNPQKFFRESGFKVLAMAELTACEYSIVLYLLNCAVSGLDMLISTEAELASLVGFDIKRIRESIENLAGRSIIVAKYGDGSQLPRLQSLSLSFNFDMSKWQISSASRTEGTHHDAIIFPFRRAGTLNLQVLDGQKLDKRQKVSGVEDSTWQRIYDSFARGRDFDHHEAEENTKMSMALADTHPVDQVLIVIRYFGQRIPTLSLLASNWQHFVEIFEKEHQKVDLSDARTKHHELDQRLREAANQILEKSSTLSLSDQEIAVLEILANHPHPRRQLFWAHQVKNRYPNLLEFFTDVLDLMLPVTTSGTVVRMPGEQN